MKPKQKAFEFSKTKIGQLIVGLIFEKFSKFLPINVVKETDKVIAFWHPKPFWEKHIVIVPKKAIKSLTSITPDELVYISEVYKVAKQIVIDLEWEKYGYTILVNGGTRQEVGQIHFHLQSEDKQVTSATNPEGYKTSHK